MNVRWVLIIVTTDVPTLLAPSLAHVIQDSHWPVMDTPAMVTDMTLNMHVGLHE